MKVFGTIRSTSVALIVGSIALIGLIGQVAMAAPDEFIVNVVLTQIWTDSQIDIQAGDVIVLDAAGTVAPGGADDSPDGWITNAMGGETHIGDDRWAFPDRPSYSIVIRNGMQGESKYVGVHSSYTCSNNGNLFFGFNDLTDAYDDNEGLIVIRVLRFRDETYGEKMFVFQGDQLRTNFLDTGLDIPEGSYWTVLAAGAVFFAPAVSTGWDLSLTGNGVAGNNFPMPGMSGGGLLCKVGDTGVLLGKGFRYDGGNHGRLQFCFNDNRTDDNTGLLAFRVGVSPRGNLRPPPPLAIGGEGSVVQPTLPQSVQINSIAPNPTNGGASIEFQTNIPQVVSVIITDALGREIVRLHDGQLNAGEHLLLWNGRDSKGTQVSNGAFYCRVQSASSTSSRMVSILK